MQALLAFSVHDADLLVRAADVACAASVEALLGTDRPYDARVQALRPHPGQLASAANLRALLAGSPLLASHRESRHAVQDADRFPFMRARRAAAARDASSAGTASPVPKYISSGVCPRNAECGSTRLCWST